jgi:hypothetical protein
MLHTKYYSYTIVVVLIYLILMLHRLILLEPQLLEVQVVVQLLILSMLLAMYW